MTDAEAAAVLRRWLDAGGHGQPVARQAAIERAIEALAEIERLRAEVSREPAERDAALAENERLRSHEHTICDALAQVGEEREAWRACADRLDEGLREALSYVPKHFVIKHAIGVEALAVHERLKGQT